MGDSSGQHHEHGQHHGHDHHREHRHAHRAGWLAKLAHVVRPHSHEAAEKVDAALEGSAEGMRALWISLGILGATALIQAAVAALSGSVARWATHCTTRPTR